MTKTGHYIAIFGGAVAGSEAAGELSKKGIRTVVFEQNPLPYGKLETGLPKWHYKLRDMQEKKIDEKLNNPLVKFIPNIKLGRDLDFKTVVEDFGFTAVLLATGAWRDRPLPVKGIDRYIGKGLIYQNPLVNWFNHKHLPDYDGPQIEIEDEAIIIGGGLASLDVVKIVTMAVAQKALKERGIEVDELTMEHKGVVQVLADHGLTFGELGLKGCRLFTRHEIHDMPLTAIPDDASPEVLEKHHATRLKMLDKVREKFPFEIIPRVSPFEKIVEEGELAGISFERTEEIGGIFRTIPNSAKAYRAKQIISAIGSVPEHIPGLPLKGEIYDVENVETGKIKDYRNVFALGNAVTGRGNIRQSMLHSRQVSENIVDQYLVWSDEDYKEIFDKAEERVDKRIDSIIDVIAAQEKLTGTEIDKIEDKLKPLEEKSGYDGNYREWIEKHLPQRLENMIK